MLRRHHSSSPARWPFWLLLAAWFCANTPQAVTYHVLVWAKGAHHFSHQARLKVDVAFLLAGRKMPRMLALAQAQENRPSPPPVPEAATVKKIDLSVAFQAGAVHPPASAAWPLGSGQSLAGCRRGEPAVPPPRSGLAV